MLPSWAVVTPARRAHIERVAALIDEWATVLEVSPVERARWLRAAWLHDALRDAPSAGELEHGPRCAERLVLEGERDQGVLDAVRFHSVGYAGWDDVGRMLYLADHLEPGRSHDREARGKPSQVYVPYGVAVHRRVRVTGDVAQRTDVLGEHATHGVEKADALGAQDGRRREDLVERFANRDHFSRLVSGYRRVKGTLHPSFP